MRMVLNLKLRFEASSLLYESANISLPRVRRALRLSLAKIKFRQLQVCRRGDFDVARRAHYHCHLMSRALDQRSFIGANVSILRGFVEGALQQLIAESLRSLGHHHALARHG